MQFSKATKKRAKLRFFLSGPTGSGKTWTALSMAKAFGERVGVIDTENESASKYADHFSFDSLNLKQPTLEGYTEAIAAAEKENYDIAVIDSLSHAWFTAQKMVDAAVAMSKSGNSFQAWAKVTPQWDQLLRRIQASSIHIIATCRSKMDYVLEELNGKKVPRKVGMAPVMRDGAEYEFDVCAEMDLDHRMLVSKSRCFEMADKVFEKPGVDVGQILYRWLDGEVVAEPAKPPDDRTAFNAMVMPMINAGRITRENVTQLLKDKNNDYAAAQKYIEEILATPA